MAALIQDDGDDSRAVQLLCAVFEAVPMALLLVDPEGTIRHANHRAALLFDYERHDMAGLACAQLLPDASSEFRTGRASVPVSSPRRSAGNDLMARRRNGDEFPAELLVHALALEGRPHFVLAVNDLAEMRNAEREVAAERESMAHMSRVTLVGEISGSLAHELNQPLAAILSNAQAALRLLRRDPGEITDIREILEDIVENDRRAGEVISRLRSLLRREFRSFGPLVVDELVHDSIRIIRNDLINRGVEYRLDLGVPISRVQGDPVQLQQVLLNLVLNACDAMEGQPRRVLTLRTEAADAGWIRVEVCDTGPGIHAERLESIFLPFQSTKLDGMGMGLAICRTLLRAHGGRIHAANLAGGGAVFCVELPILE